MVDGVLCGVILGTWVIVGCDVERDVEMVVMVGRCGA